MEAENARLKAENASLKAEKSAYSLAILDMQKNMSKHFEEQREGMMKIRETAVHSAEQHRIEMLSATRLIDVCQAELKALKASLSGSASGKASTALLGGYEQKYLKYKSKYLSQKNSQ